MKAGILLLIISVFLAGCKKQNVDAINQTPTSVTTLQTVSTYTAISKIGMTHGDTYFYYNEEMSNGFPLAQGEKLVIIGEGERFYIAFYGDEKGYVIKSHVLIFQDDGNSVSNKATSKVVESRNVVVDENVITKVITQTQDNVPDDFEAFVSSLEKELEDKDSSSINTALSIPTTAAPPKTLYVTKLKNDTEESAILLTSINKYRTAANLSTLNMDNDLASEAAYYCEKFASNSSAGNIDGYNVQATGRIKGNKIDDKIGKSIVSRIEGFNSNTINKIGISVIKNEDRGYVYYVVIAR